MMASVTTSTPGSPPPSPRPLSTLVACARAEKHEFRAWTRVGCEHCPSARRREEFEGLLPPLLPTHLGCYSLAGRQHRPGLGGNGGFPREECKRRAPQSKLKPSRGWVHKKKNESIHSTLSVTHPCGHRGELRRGGGGGDVAYPHCGVVDASVVPGPARLLGPGEELVKSPLWRVRLEPPHANLRHRHGLVPGGNVPRRSGACFLGASVSSAERARVLPIGH